MIKIPGVSIDAFPISNQPNECVKEVTAIPPEDQYIPSIKPEQSKASPGQPTIYGKKVLKSNVNELRKKFNIK